MLSTAVSNNHETEIYVEVSFLKYITEVKDTDGEQMITKYDCHYKIVVWKV